MAASLYRLAGKPHYTEQTQIQTVDETTNVTVAAPEQEQVEESQAKNEADESVVAVPSWDPAWTKTRLLEFAVSIGLEVSPTNTKAEIISALQASA